MIPVREVIGEFWGGNRLLGVGVAKKVSLNIWKEREICFHSRLKDC